MTSEEIAARLGSVRYRKPQDELRLQEELAAVLGSAGVAFEREVKLSVGDRIDFLLASGVGIEVKVAGGAVEVTRQLLRYAEHERVAELILFTTRAQIVVPRELGGKRVRTVHYYAGL